jgi:hypothetical protein
MVNEFGACVKGLALREYYPLASAGATPALVEAGG